MHALLLSGVVSVWIFTGTFVDGALTILYTGSNKVDSTSYSLKCDIQGFSAQATLSRNGILIAQCLPSVCVTTPASPYSNRHDTTAIYVDFSTLAASEDGIQWTCAHAGDTSVTFDVEIDFGVTVESCDHLTIYFTWFTIHTCIQALVLIGINLKIRRQIKNHTFNKRDLEIYLTIQIGLDFFTSAAIVMWGLLYGWFDFCYFRTDPNCSVVYIALGWLVYAVIWKFLTPLVIYFSYKDKTVHASNDKTERASNAMPILAPPNVQKDKTERASNAMPILAPPNVQKADKSVMLLVEKIDRELPTKIIWTNTNGTVPKDTPKYSYGVLPKISLKINSVLKEDTGIYQCVRTLQNGKKDNINVVLRVTDICGITLKVNPLFWENKIFEQPVTQLTEMVKSITLASNLKNKTTKNKIESVEWKYRSEKVDVNTILTEIDYSILSEAKEGEYTCSVKLSNETQLYVFHIVFLDQVPSKLKTSNGVCVIGVPSMLHSTGIQKLKEDELNDQQNKQI